MGLTPKGKKLIRNLIVLIILAVVVVFGGDWLLNESGWIPGFGNSSGSATVTVTKSDGTQEKVTPINACVVTWGGYAGGQYFNGGFNASADSRYYTDYGIMVNFAVIDDYMASRAAWKSGDCDLLWMTFDSFGTEVDDLVRAGFNPVAVFQADWSRGGDAIVVTREIKTADDLRGKSIAVAYGTPSHTYLLRQLQASGLTANDVEIIEVPSAIDAATAFKGGQVDAAVVWSPDDQDCVDNVTGAHILSSTKDATHIIADGFYAQKEWVDGHLDELTPLIEGWLIGAAEINSNPQAKERAAEILSVGLNIPKSDAMGAIDNVRLATYGDNVEFFELESRTSGVNGENLYNSSGRLFQGVVAPSTGVRLIDGSLPTWRNVVDTRALRAVNLTASGIHNSEAGPQFSEVRDDMAQAEAYATQELTVTFPTGSATLDENAKMLIEMAFVPTAQAFASSRIRIEGNTDNTGSYQGNKSLSHRRAESVRDFLVREFGFNPNRFIVVGNGPDEPITSNNTPEGRAQNRRTDFELIRQ